MKTACWEQVPLGELVELKYGKALKAEHRPEDGPFPVYGSNGIVGTSYTPLVEYPTIVIGRKGAVGAAHLAEHGCWPIDTTFYTSPRPDYKIDLRYLLLWLRSLDLKHLAITSTIPGLNLETLGELKVPLPPLSEQEQIVRILDEAEELRRLRERADRRTADLIPAIFHEMFGDPATNPKGWPVSALGDLVETVSGGTPSKERGDFWIGTIPWVSPKDVKQPEIQDAEDHVSEQAVQETKIKVIPPQSILIVVRGMILAHTVPIRMNLVPVTINQDMKALLPGGRVQSMFLRWALQTRHADILVQVSTAGHGTKRFETGDLLAIQLPVPPLTLQREFAARVAEVQAMEAKQAESRRRLDDLFASLLHRAFRGEL